MCLDRVDIHVAARIYAGTRLAILKRVGPPEFAEIVQRETTLRARLLSVHRAASRAAIDRARKLIEGRSTPSPRLLSEVLSATRRTFERVLTKPAREAVEEAVPHFYRLGKTAAYRKAIGASKTRLEMPPVKKAEAGTLAELAPSFTAVDLDAIEALSKQQTFWIGEFYEDNVSKRMRMISTDVILARGLTGKEGGRVLADAMAREFDIIPEPYLRPPGVPVPPGWKGSAEAYYHGIAANTATVGRVVGSVAGFRDVGVSHLEIVNPMDERTCPRCGAMDGKVIELSTAAQQVDGVLAAKSPDDVRAVHPWHNDKAFAAVLSGAGVKPGAGTVSAVGQQKLLDGGVVLPPFHMACVLPGQVVQGSVVAVSQAGYSGDAVELITGKGRYLSLTPNHPVLTAGGFTPAGAVCQGDKVVCYRCQVGVTSLWRRPQGDEDQTPPPVEDIFGALAERSCSVTAPPSVDDFHGDAICFDGNVRVVRPDRELLLWKDPAFAQKAREVVLESADPVQASVVGPGGPDLLGERCLASATGIPGGGTLPNDPVGGRLDSLPLRALRLGSPTQPDPGTEESTSDGGAGGITLVCELLNRFPGEIEFDHVVQVRKLKFSGHVYDLQTVTGWMIAQDIVIHNCRCTIDVSEDALVVPLEPPPEAKPEELPPHRRPFAWTPDDMTVLPRQLGGAHAGKLNLEAPDGTRWIWKPVHKGDEFRAYGEKAAGDLGRALGLDTPEIYTWKYKGQFGTVQREAIGIAGDMRGLELTTLTTQQWDDLLTESAYNWLIGDNDGHGGNFLVRDSGRLVGIDKGQLFKFFDRDKLDWKWNPNQPMETSLLHQFLGRYTSGQCGNFTIPDRRKLKGLQQFVKAVEGMDDAAFTELIKPYSSHASVYRLAGKPIGPFARWSEDEFLQAALKRKHDLRKDWYGFLNRAESARKKALGIVARKPAVGGAISPIDADWVKGMRESKWRGKSIMVGGHDVEDMHILVYPTKDGGTWMEMKLRVDADRRMLGKIGDETLEQVAADPLYNDVLKIAKSYNAHLDPSHPTFDGKIKTEMEELFKATYKKTLMSDAPPCAKHYQDYLNNLIDEIEIIPPKFFGHKIGNVKWKLGDDAALSKKGVKLEKWTPPKVEVPKGKVEWTQIADFDWERELTPDGEIKILKGKSVWGGKGFEVEPAPGIKVYYTPHGGTSFYSKAGRLKVHIDKAPGKITPKDVEGALDVLRGLGIETRLADAADMELLYLRKTAYVAGWGEEALIQVPESLSREKQIEGMLRLWSEKAKKDVRRSKHYSPLPQWDSEKLDGRPRWLRFDIAPQLEKMHKEGWSLIHQDFRGASLEELVEKLTTSGTNTLICTEERLRVGLQTLETIRKIGGSSYGDMGYGGASYVFTRVNAPTNVYGRMNALSWDIRMLRDTDALSYNHDAWGRCRPQYIKQNRKNATIRGIKSCAPHSTNESDFKGRLMLRGIVRANAGSEGQRQRVIEAFKRGGFTEIGGRKVEDIVVVAR